MDTLLPLVCLLVGIALPATLGFFLVRRGWRQMAAPAAYRQVARELSLDVDTRGASVNGYLPETRQRLYIGEVMVGHGPHRRFEHRGVLTFARPLGLGLAIRRRSGRRWFRRARGHEITTGDADFDKSFLVTGDDDDLVRGLLGDVARERVIALARRHPDLLISDHVVRVILKRPETDPVAVHRIVQELRDIAEVFARCRSALQPPPRVRELVPALGDLAAQRGLTLDPAWPLLTGRVDDREIELVIRREEDGYRAVVAGWFRTPTDIGFRLRRQVEPDGYWSVGQDIQVDDDAFDSAFVIKGYAPDAVRRRLSPAARRRLLSLADLGEVTADDHHVRIRRLALDPAVLSDALDRMAGALDALDR